MVRKLCLIFILLLLFTKPIITQTNLNLFVEPIKKELKFKINTKKYLGLPYRWGSIDTTKGVDCSGLIYNVFKDNKITIPRGSYNQVKDGTEVALKDLKYGDLLFFDIKKGKISHVAIYLDSCILHSVRRGVVIDSLNSNHWRVFKRYLVVCKRFNYFK